MRKYLQLGVGEVSLERRSVIAVVWLPLDPFAGRRRLPELGFSRIFGLALLALMRGNDARPHFVEFRGVDYVFGFVWQNLVDVLLRHPNAFGGHGMAREYLGDGTRCVLFKRLDSFE